MPGRGTDVNSNCGKGEGYRLDLNVPENLPRTNIWSQRAEKVLPNKSSLERGM